MEEKEMLIKIYNQQDRLDVAQILIKKRIHSITGQEETNRNRENS